MEKEKLRVVAYCRVSTEKGDQANSLTNQKTYFETYIQNNPTWELVEIYADEGVTGTSTKKRYAFHRMIEDASNHQFDLIITKEISRFARNTLDSIYYTRKLKELGIGVLFLNDNINTLDADSELRLTIMASIAQEESRKTSERVKWGQKRRMEQGIVFGRDLLGYDVCNGKLIINEKGAEIVRLIFHKYVNEGKGTHRIAKELTNAGIPTATYMKQWSNATILRILKNEKYCGDLIQKKTYTPNYLNHQKKYNRGEETFVVLKNHHEPIISRKLFEQAQYERKRRFASSSQKAKHSNRYCFSGKIHCGVCGHRFVSRSKKRKDGSIYHAWRCFENTKNGRLQSDENGNTFGCNIHSLNDENVKQLLMDIVHKLIFPKEAFTQNLVSLLQTAMAVDEIEKKDTQQIQKEILQLSNKKRGVIELFLNQEISKSEFQELSKKYENEIETRKQKLVETKANENTQSDIEKQAKTLSSTILNLINGKEWNDTFYRNLLEKIVVFEDFTLSISFQSLPHPFRYFLCNTSQAKERYEQLIIKNHNVISDMI